MKRIVTYLLWPIVCFWASQHQVRILRRGLSLTREGLELAARAGVLHPGKVRTLVVECVPPRVPLGLRTIAARFSWGPETTSGMALGYGIYLRADQVGRRDLLFHELVHTAQYERLGFRFIRKVCAKERFLAG